jgi:hypothetical protein
MKAYLFIETGEVRLPKESEWYYDNTGVVLLSRQNFKFVSASILTRHEIEVPEGANNMTVAFQNINGCLRGSMSRVEIPIPRPKVKVKRWWWDFEDDNAADGFSTSGPYTEEEVKADYPNAKWYHRIDETMVEVPE